MIKPNPVGWFEIYVKDMPRARKFYETVLGGKLEALPVPNPEMNGGMEMLAFPMERHGSGAAGALVKMNGMAPAGGCPGTMVYFVCDDCAVEGARIEAAGGKVMKPKMSIGQYGFIVIAADSEGNGFGLHSMK